MRRYLQSCSFLLLYRRSRNVEQECCTKMNLVGGLRFLQTTSNSEGNFHFPHTKMANSGDLELQIVNVLHLGHRERASDLLKNLVSVSISPKAEDFINVLDYCSRAPDPLFAMETWRLMEENAIEISEGCWIHIIQSLSHGGYLKEAFNLLNYLGESDRSVTPMYNIFLNGCAQSRNFAQANNCLQLMEDSYIGKSETTYLQMLKLAVQQNNLPLVHQIWKELKVCYDPNIITLHKFIWSFSKLNDLESAIGVLKLMVAMAIQEIASVGISSRGKYKVRFDIPIPYKDDLTCKMFTAKDDTCSSVPKVDRNATKIGDAFLGNDLAALSLENLINGHEGNNQADICGGHLKVKTVSDATSNEARGVNLAKVLERDANNSNRCTVGIRGKILVVNAIVLYSKKVCLYNFLFDSLRNCEAILIHACARSDKCHLAEKLFQQMNNLGLQPSAETYDGLIRAVIYDKGANYGVELLKETMKRNLKPSSSTIAAISIAYSKVLELDLAVEILDQISITSPKSIYPFNALLSTCYALEKPERALQVFTKMKSLSIKPDIKTYELLFRLFGNVNVPYEVPNVFSQEALRKRIRCIEMDMFRNGVEHNSFTLAHVIRAVASEGMTDELLQYLDIAEKRFTDAYPGTVTYNYVLHELVEARDNHAAVEFFKRMRLCAIPADSATYTTMIDCCSISKSYKTANALISLMLRSGFSPTAYTYSVLMKVLIANENIDEALKLLEQLFEEGLEADVLVFNTILQEASEKGYIDIVELVVEQMHRVKIQPDPTTCYFLFAAYLRRHLINTGMEALQVLSMRMISKEEDVLQEKKASYEYLVYSGDPKVDTWISEIFDVGNVNLGAALFNLRWCAICGCDISRSPNTSPWAKRLSVRYDTWKRIN